MTTYITPHEARATDPLETPYPARWLDTRWAELETTFNVIRSAYGSPLKVTRGRAGGGYSPPEWAVQTGRKANSQHCHGRALDIQPTDLGSELAAAGAIADLHALILELHQGGKLPLLGALGRYVKFVHFDTRVSRRGPNIARWRGSGAG